MSNPVAGGHDRVADLDWSRRRGGSEFDARPGAGVTLTVGVASRPRRRYAGTRQSLLRVSCWRDVVCASPHDTGRHHCGCSRRASGSPDGGQRRVWHFTVVPRRLPACPRGAEQSAAPGVEPGVRCVARASESAHRRTDPGAADGTYEATRRIGKMFRVSGADAALGAITLREAALGVAGPSTQRSRAPERCWLWRYSGAWPPPVCGRRPNECAPPSSDSAPPRRVCAASASSATRPRKIACGQRGVVAPPVPIRSSRASPGRAAQSCAR